MKIPITFLGTSCAVPIATRNHTSILLSYKTENILVDCGEGTQRQFRKAKLNPCKITKLIITHLHGDHVFGIPGLFQTLNLNGYQKTLQVYGPKGTKRFIKNIFKTFIATKEIKIKVNVNEVKNKVFENSDFKITALPLEHGILTLGYVFQEKNKLRIDKTKLKKLFKKIKPKKENLSKLSKLTQGKNIKINNQLIKSKNLTYSEKGKKISFIFDTKLCNNAKKLAKDSDLAVIESSLLEPSKYKHLTARQAAQIAKQAKAKQLVLTHLSQRYEHKENLLLKQAKKIFPKTTIAEDLMRVEV